MCFIVRVEKNGLIWKTKPPYSNWKPYSSALADYAAERLAVHNTELESAQEIFERNRDKLEESGTNREINNRLAAKLLPYLKPNQMVGSRCSISTRGSRMKTSISKFI